MSHDTHTTDRRTYLKTTGAAALGAAGLTSLSGCLGGATGTLATYVTDQPGDIADFESCVVTIAGVRLGPADIEGEEDDGGDGADNAGDGADDGTETEADGTETEAASTEAEGREYVEFDEPQDADLVELADGSTQLMGETELEPGEHGYLQLDVTGVDATLEDGSDAEVDTPGNAPLKFDRSFEVREDTRTEFTADFTPVQQGGSGGYLLRPVADGVEVRYVEVDGEATPSPTPES